MTPYKNIKVLRHMSGDVVFCQQKRAGRLDFRTSRIIHRGGRNTLAADGVRGRERTK
jgi:hypothetical protein